MCNPLFLGCEQDVKTEFQAIQWAAVFLHE
ncbi:MAG: hypothetical protein RLZZ262_2659 [Bacteroidota bacterium]|jgi:hypothetical protein